MSERVLGSEQIDKGKPFQIEGPTTAKARFCLVEVRANGTRRRPCSAERRERELRALCVGPQNSTRPSKQRHTNALECSRPIFNSLPSREPMQDAAHIGRNVVIFRYATNRTGCRAQNAIQAA